MKTQRRSVLKNLLASVLGMTGLSLAAKAKTGAASAEKVSGNITYQQKQPLFAGHTIHNGIVYIAGKGWHSGNDIKVHTDEVLKALEKELKLAGSSMDKVLKVSVYLNDMADYAAMNSVYLGRFGTNPPVRTCTAAAKGGVPGNSLVEMDCIAYI